MANETLSIQKDNARLTVIGKSKADTYIDSGLGLELGDLDIGSLDPFDLNWQLFVPDLSNLPDEIKITQPPTKTSYADGERVNLDGIVVRAYKSGSPWNGMSGKYTDGYIPRDELHYQPLVVSSDGGGGSGEVVPDSFIVPFVRPLNVGDSYLSIFEEPISQYYAQYDMTAITSSGKFITWYEYDFGNNAYTVVASAEPGVTCHMYSFSRRATIGNPGDFDWTRATDEGTQALDNEYTYHGKKVYWAYTGRGSSSSLFSCSPELTSTTESVQWDAFEHIAWTIIYGMPAENNVEVGWLRPGDGLELTDTFAITDA